MKKLLIAAGIVIAATAAAPLAASAQGYVLYGPPAVAVYPAAPAYGLYDYAPVAPTPYGYYSYAPGGWYGAYDTSHNSYRQPSPRSTIRAVR